MEKLVKQARCLTQAKASWPVTIQTGEGSSSGATGVVSGAQLGEHQPPETEGNLEGNLGQTQQGDSPMGPQTSAMEDNREETSSPDKGMINPTQIQTNQNKNQTQEHNQGQENVSAQKRKHVEDVEGGKESDNENDENNENNEENHGDGASGNVSPSFNWQYSDT